MTDRRTTEAARVDRLGESVDRVMGALDEFMKFEGPDPAAKRSVWRPLLDEPLPREGHGADAVLDALEQVVIGYGLRMGTPGFSGWITTMPSVVPTVASLAGNIVACQRWWSAPGNFLEVHALRWLCELLGLDPETGGTFTSGGSTANLICLCAARQHAGERLGVNICADGVAAIPRPRVYATEAVHDVVTRALGVLGLGALSMREIPTGPDRLPILPELEAMIDADIAEGCTPIAVVATAGDVRTGTIEPIDAMREIAHARGIWIHVDGAYGGFGVLDERVAHLYGALDKVDSIAIDPHKWLAVPLGCGTALIRDEQLYGRSLAMGRPDFHKFDARTQGDPGSPFDEFGEGSLYSSVDFSARSRGLTVWAILKEIGIEGMRARVGRHLDCARRIAERARAHPQLEVLSEPVLSICCFRYVDDRLDAAALDTLNEDILRLIRQRGQIPSSARISGVFAIRPCFISPTTELADADALIDAVLEVGADLAMR